MRSFAGGQIVSHKIFGPGVVYATGGGLTPPCKVCRNDRTTHQEVAGPVSMRITPMFQLKECGAILHLP